MSNFKEAEDQYQFGEEYYKKGDYPEAVRWYRKSAEQGNAKAQNSLGFCYHHGQGVTQDYSEAVKWYRKSAEQGNADAQNNLGFCYQHGQGVTRDYSEAVKWYRKSAEQGNTYAQTNLGFCYQHGQGVTQDYSEAVKWYRKSAEQGNADAQNNLGVCYHNGQGVTQDYSEAVKWYRKSAEQGNTYGQYDLALCYEKGQGVTQDYSEAMKWYKKASDKGLQAAKDKVEGKLSAKHGHVYVDLGLPSGLKWATCNVGANKPEDYGDYFAWGETETKTEYTKGNSLTSEHSISELRRRGIVDGKNRLTSSYDAARAKWGGSWRMPTKEELEELEENCRWTWTTQNGVEGYKVTGPNGNSIFLPAAGYCGGASLYNGGYKGNYWSSTPNDDFDYGAYELYFFNGNKLYVCYTRRYFGYTVRPITE